MYARFSVGENTMDSVFILENIGTELCRIISNGLYVKVEYQTVSYSKEKTDETLFIYKTDENGGKYFITPDKSILSISSLRENQLVVYPVENQIRGVNIPHISINYCTERESQMFEFMTKGFVILQTNFSPKRLQLDAQSLINSGHRSISELHKIDPLFNYYIELPELHIILFDILFDYHLSSFSGSVSKTGRDDRFWHTDYPYHDIYGEYPQEIQGIQVIYALTDFTIENGCPSYLPKSFEYKCGPDFDTKYEDLPNQCYFTVPKGSMIIFRADLWHASGLNLTKEPRVSLLANFVRSNIKIKG